MRQNSAIIILLFIVVTCLFIFHVLLVVDVFFAPTNHHVCESSSSRACHWAFVQYLPSPYESYWTQNIASLQTDVCTESNKQSAEIEGWMTHARLSSSNPTELPGSIFSKFIFRNNCTGEIVTDYIEPLAGLTRSPLFCMKGDDFVVEKDYLVMSWNVSRKLLVNKAFYFDLGASLYDAGAGGASQSWLVERFEARGVRWDGIFGWEAMAHPPSDVWSKIPAHLKPVYHWYNIPVDPGPNHPDNALNYIRQIAKPQDYVLLKIDIDTTLIEEALVRQLMKSEELLSLVDEFIFEHHVNTAPMHKFWNTAGEKSKLEDTYRIFGELRHKGILAHSWV